MWQDLGLAAVVLFFLLLIGFIAEEAREQGHRQGK